MGDGLVNGNGVLFCVCVFTCTFCNARILSDYLRILPQKVILPVLKSGHIICLPHTHIENGETGHSGAL